MSDESRPPGGKDSGELPVAWHDTPGSPEQRHASKRQLLETALAQGKTLVRVDARRPGVHVPERFAGDHALALNLSWRFAHTEMVINERGVAATLRFGGVASRCVLPWSALWGLVLPGNDALHVWPLDLPVELGGPPLREDEPSLPVEPVRPRLSVVSEEPPAPPEPEPVAEEPAVEAKAEEPPTEPSAEPSVEAPAEPAAPGSAAQRAPWLRLVR